jgi:hypothetical protein
MMFDDINPVESLVNEIKGNTGFLGNLLYPGLKLIAGLFFFGILIALLYFVS